MTGDSKGEAVRGEHPSLAPPGPAVIVLEDPRDTDHACSLAKGQGAATFVPAGAAACWELERRGLPFQPIAGFSDPGDLSALGLANYDLVERLCTEIDEGFRGRGLLPVVSTPLCPAGDNFFAIKILLDGLTLRARMLKGMGERLRQGTVFAFRHGRPGLPPPLPVPFHPDEGLFERLLELPGWPFRTLSVPVPGLPGETGGTPGPRQKLFPFPHGAPGVSFLSDLAFLLKQGRAGDALSLSFSGLRNRLFSADELLISGFGYRWNDLIPALSREGYGITHWDPMQDPADNREPVDTQAVGEVLDTVLTRYGRVGQIDLSPLLKEKLGPILAGYLRSAPLQAGRIQNLFTRVRPVALLCGTKSSWGGQLVARSARARRIPVISWQHGAQGFFRAPMMGHVELRHSDIHLCFGEGVRDLIGREFPGSAPKRVIPVGSYQLQELVLGPGTPPRDPPLLYATTSYPGNNLYVGGIGEEPILDTDFWETQRAILDVIGESGRRAVFKLHPGDTPSDHLRGYIAARGYQYITLVKDEQGFTDLVRQAGVVVLDCPSTTLLEAAAAGKEVFVLLKHVRLTESAMGLLRKRAYLSGDLGEFTRLLGRYLRGEETGQHPDRQNTEFLEAYGVHQLDGKVEERALAVIRSLRREERTD